MSPLLAIFMKQFFSQPTSYCCVLKRFVRNCPTQELFQADLDNPPLVSVDCDLILPSLFQLKPQERYFCIKFLLTNENINLVTLI